MSTNDIPETATTALEQPVTDAYPAAESTESALKTPYAAPLNQDKPLSDKENPDTPPPMDIDQINKKMLPGETVNDYWYRITGQKNPRALQPQYVPPRKRAVKKRRLKTITNLADVQRELFLLYSDFHHKRINGLHATKGAYMLTCLGQALRMGQTDTPASGKPAKRDKKSTAKSTAVRQHPNA